MPQIRTRNQPIGTCPCPFKGCEKIGSVYRYRAQSDDPKRQRRAGRLYMRCEDHGQSQDQEWILNNGKVDGAPAPAVEPTPAEEPAPTPAKPAAPAKPSRASKSTPAKPAGWGFFDA